MIIRELINLLSLEVNEQSFQEGENRIIDVEEALAFLAAASAAAALAIASLVDHVQHVTRSAALLGVGTDRLQEWGYAATAAGADVDNFAESLLDLEDKMDDAAQGGKEYQALFTRLGVDVKDSQGNLKSLETFLPEVADAFANMAAGTERSGIASRLLGETGAKTLLPMFTKGAAGLRDMAAEARALGTVLDEDAIRDTMAFRGELGRTTAVLQSMVYGIGRSLLPATEDLLVSLRSWIRENRALIASGFEVAMRVFSVAARVTVQALAPLLALVVFLARDLGGARLAMYALMLALTIYTGNAVRSAIASTMGFIASMVAKIAVTKTYTDMLGRTVTRLELLSVAEMKAAITGAAAPYVIAAAWGALLILLGLVIEDIYTFSQGGDSLIGRWGEWITRATQAKPDDGPIASYFKTVLGLWFNYQETVERIGRWQRGVLSGVGDVILGYLRGISDFWNSIGKGDFAGLGDKFMQLLGPFGTWLQWLGSLLEKVQSVLSWLGGSPAENISGFVQGLVSLATGDVKGALSSVLDSSGAVGRFLGRMQVGMGGDAASVDESLRRSDAPDWTGAAGEFGGAGASSAWDYPGGVLGRAASPAAVLGQPARAGTVIAPSQENNNTFIVGSTAQAQDVRRAVVGAQEEAWEGAIRTAQVGLSGG